MDYTIEQIKGGVKINLNLNKDEWEKELDKSFQKNKAKYTVAGFRKGHATRKMIENMYGPVFMDDAINSGFYMAYSKALDEHEEIYPVDEPKVDIAGMENGGIQFVAEVTVKPELKLGEYKNLKIDKAEYTVTDEEVDAEINAKKEQQARIVEVTDRKVKDGDILKLDYSGSVDGVKFDGGTAENADLTIGSKTFIPGFEDGLIGAEIGKTTDIKVTFPEDYQAENLKGKEAVFTCTVKTISEKQYPELNDAFAQDVSTFDTFADYKKDVKEKITENKQKRADNEDENNLIKKVAEGSVVEIPDCMIEQQLDYIIEDMSYRIQYMYQGLKFEDYLKYTGSSIEQFRADRRGEAEENVKTRLTLEEIIKAEDIKVSEAELDEEIAKIADNAKKSVKEYKKTIQPQQMRYIENDVLTRKLVEFLKTNNTFVKAAKKATAAKTSTAKAATGETAKKAPAKKATAAKK